MPRFPADAKLFRRLGNGKACFKGVCSAGDESGPRVSEDIKNQMFSTFMKVSTEKRENRYRLSSALELICRSVTSERCVGFSQCPW
jgi:hypothetical protein